MLVPESASNDESAISVERQKRCDPARRAVSDAEKGRPWLICIRASYRRSCGASSAQNTDAAMAPALLRQIEPSMRNLVMFNSNRILSGVRPAMSHYGGEPYGETDTPKVEAKDLEKRNKKYYKIGQLHAGLPGTRVPLACHHVVGWDIIWGFWNAMLSRKNYNAARTYLSADSPATRCERSACAGSPETSCAGRKSGRTFNPLVLGLSLAPSLARSTGPRANQRRVPRFKKQPFRT